MKTGNRDQGSGISQAEETLRLLARLPAPEGLEERVQAHLAAAAKTVSPKARLLRWPAVPQGQSSLARLAAAAAIAAVVVGGGWVVCSRFQPAQPAQAVTAPPHGAAQQGGFSRAGAMRTPQTLNGPVVAAPAVAHPANATQTTQSVAQPEPKTLHRVKHTATREPISPTPR
jgi:hypothetical protein